MIWGFKFFKYIICTDYLINKYHFTNNKITRHGGEKGNDVVPFLQCAFNPIPFLDNIFFISDGTLASVGNLFPHIKAKVRL
jgi:hypothetical protein